MISDFVGILGLVVCVAGVLAISPLFISTGIGVVVLGVIAAGMGL